MMQGIRIAVLFLTFLTCLASEKNYTESDILFNDLFSNYKKDLLPQINPRTPVVLNVSFLLMGIREFDEMSGKFSVFGCFIFNWDDFRLKWNASSYGDFRMLVIPENNVWIPNPTLLNPYDNLKLFSGGKFPVSIGHKGNLVWAPGGIISTVCDVDVTYYPFDVQVCQVLFLCWGYTHWSVVLNLPSSKVQMDFFSNHGEWELVNTSMTLVGYINAVSVDMKIRRRPRFVVLNFILPVFFMVVLNLFVFVLPVDSGERVSYSITVLLAIAVFLTLVGENLPKTSLQTAMLSYFLLSYLVISSIICVFVIISSSLYYADEKTKLFAPFVRIAKGCRLKKTSKYTLKETDCDYLKETNDARVSFKAISKWFDCFAFSLCLISIIASIILFFVVYN